ncbi:uncharacterized protein LOC142568334 [Dermacentor variabilis]|uniref:uncharacterized protein LOC142568334 n=1 Tax=Dermacentor variabilis TaxID=34621 RepID=UPI003F5BC3E8
MSHRASSSKPGDVLDLEIGSDDDDFLGEVKSPACSAKPAAQLPQPPSLSAAGAARPLDAPSQPEPTAQLQGDGSSGTASPSPEHRARRADADRPGHPDLRDKLNLIRCHRRRKSKRRRSRSGGDLRSQLSDHRERADHDADEEPRAPAVGAPSGRRRAVFRGGSRAGNGGRRNGRQGFARRRKAYIDLDRPAEEDMDDILAAGPHHAFTATHYRQVVFRQNPGSSAPAPCAHEGP